jgi:iron complex outermembrane recepter protein
MGIRLVLSLFFVLTFSGPGWGQDQPLVTLRRQVLDEASREPLVGVNIRWPGTDIGTTTDTGGNFVLQLPASAELEFSYVGYQPLLLPVAQLREQPEIVMVAQELELPLLYLWAPKLNYDDQYTPTVQRLASPQLLAGDAINIAEAFDGLPGVQVQQGALNTQRLSLRGIGARTPFATDQVRLYWNDIPLTNGAGESVLEDIESGFLRTAYVQTGPAPAQLGANLGGSIQLVSREWQGTNWSPSGGTSAGSFGRNRQWLNLHNTASNWEQDLSVVRSQSAGYRDNNDYQRLSGTLLGRLEQSRSNTVYFVHARQLAAEIPSSLNAVDFAERPTAAAANWAAVNGREDQLTYLVGIQQFRALATLGAKQTSLTNRSSLFTGRRTNDEVRPFDVLAEDSYQYGLRTNFNFTNTRNWLQGTIQLGGEAFWEDYSQTTFETLTGGTAGERLGDQSERRFYYFAFAQWERHWPGKRWRTYLDLNLRQTRYQWETGNVRITFPFDPVFLPGVSVFYQPTAQLQLHARYNRGISPPDAAASITNYTVASQPLRATTGWNRELGVNWQVAGASFWLTAFQMDLDDVLVTRQDAAERTFFFNGGTARHQGIEAQLHKSWSLGASLLGVDLQYTLADYRFRAFADARGDFSGQRIPGNPPHRFQTRLNWTVGDFSTGLTLDIADRQATNDANSDFAAGYTLLHLRAGYLFAGLGRGLRMYAGVNNLLDVRYASMVQVNATGFGGALPRSFYPGLPQFFYLGIDYGL